MNRHCTWILGDFFLSAYWEKEEGISGEIINLNVKIDSQQTPKFTVKFHRQLGRKDHTGDNLTD